MNNHEKQLWALAYTANDGSAGIYPFYFTPTDEIQSPDLNKTLEILGLNNSEDVDAGGWAERIDKDMDSAPVYPQEDATDPTDDQDGDHPSDQTIHFKSGENDITVVTPSGERIILQYRDEGKFPSVDVCFEKQRHVSCWGKEMEDAPQSGPLPNERICFQLWIGLDPNGKSFYI